MIRRLRNKAAQLKLKKINKIKHQTKRRGKEISQYKFFLSLKIKR